MRRETDRLILRPWEDRDRPELARILGDPIVRRFYPAQATPEQVNAQIDFSIARAAEHGFHVQAAESKADGRLVGLIGMARLDEALRAATSAEVEIGWQFDKDFWGQGLAPEGARAWLDYAWEIGLDEVVAFTATINTPSQRVMEKIGMLRDPNDDFDHPRVADGHILKRHVLYRIKAPQ